MPDKIPDVPLPFKGRVGERSHMQRLTSPSPPRGGPGRGHIQQWITVEILAIEYKFS